MNEIYITDRIRAGIHFVMDEKTKWKLNLTPEYYKKIHTDPSTLPEEFPLLEQWGMMSDEDRTKWIPYFQKSKSIWGTP